jgi:peptidoglycan/LPS O-acetylase OafA/YrhL
VKKLTRSYHENYQLEWIDLVKGVALLWIFLNHTVERIFGAPFFANPSSGWPAMEDRISQLAPVKVDGLWGGLLNITRWVGWSGDEGVQLFLLVSGFGLTWGLLKTMAGSRLSLREFYAKRLMRIYPPWWIAHLVALPVMIILGLPVLDDYRFYLSLVGIRFSSDLLYYIQPAWWYIGLLLQLYLLFPALWYLLKNTRTQSFVTLCVFLPLAIRFCGLLLFDGYLDAWSRGAVFITRLPEFALGMLLAERLHEEPKDLMRSLTSWAGFFVGMGVYVAGFALAFSLSGMTVSTVLLGIGSFLLLLKPLNWLTMSRFRIRIPLLSIGKHSYSLFLMHGFFVRYMVPAGYSVEPPLLAFRVAGAFVLTVVSALVLDWFVNQSLSAFGDVAQRRGTGRAVAQTLGLILFGFISLVVGEEAVRRCSPQEVFGWGERPSLEADSAFGWRLIPNLTSRLRWESYDYVMRANSLGFPGAEYPAKRQANTFRIFVTGDAFTSAEGVATDSSWPRILESRLNSTNVGRRCEVLNFAVTGYGPMQEQAVVDSFVPVYQPDLVIVELFVNDFEDVLSSNEDFRKSIGFSEISQDGVASYLRLAHLSHYLKNRIFEPVVGRLRSQPSPRYGYSLGNFGAFERRREELTVEGKARVMDCLWKMQKSAAEHGAEILLVIVPASIQVCRPTDLSYYPRNVDLSDTTIFDLEMPQRMAFDIAHSLRINAVDLRRVFLNNPDVQVYQPANMHWTNQGHDLVARFLAELLTTPNVLK